MTIAKKVKTAAKKTEKALVEPVVKGAKKLLKPVTNSLKTKSGKSSARSKKRTTSTRKK